MHLSGLVGPVVGGTFSVTMEDASQTSLMKSIHTSPFSDSHRPHVSTIEQN